MCICATAEMLERTKKIKKTQTAEAIGIWTGSRWWVNNMMLIVNWFRWLNIKRGGILVRFTKQYVGSYRLIVLNAVNNKHRNLNLQLCYCWVSYAGLWHGSRVLIIKSRLWRKGLGNWYMMERSSLVPRNWIIRNINNNITTLPISIAHSIYNPQNHSSQTNVSYNFRIIL